MTCDGTDRVVEATAARRRRSILPLLMGATVFGIAAAAVGPWPAGVFYDDGIYLILGKAVAQGEGYRFLHLPGTPSAVHYPPGYPAVLAILWWILPGVREVVSAAKLINAALLALGAAGVTCLIRSRFDLPMWAVVGAVVAGTVCIPVLATAGVLLSEPLFLAALIAALMSAEGAVAGDRDRPVRQFAVGMMLGAVGLIRTIGVAALMGCVAVLMMRRRGRAAGMIVSGSMVALAPWFGWSAAHAAEVPDILVGSYGSYMGWYLGGLQRDGVDLVLRIAAMNLRDLARPFGVLMAPWVGVGAWLRVSLLGIGGVIAVRGLRRLTRSAPVTGVFLIIYLSIVVFWPYPPDRFLWGVWPLIAAVFALGVPITNPAGWRLRDPSTWWRVVVLGGAALSVAGFARYNVKGFAHRWWESAQRGAAEAMQPSVRWVLEHTDPGDVVSVETDPLVYLYTGRQVMPTTAFLPEERMAAQSLEAATANLRVLLETYEPAYVLLPSRTARAAAAVERLLGASPPELVMIDSLAGGGGVFRPVVAGRIGAGRR